MDFVFRRLKFEIKKDRVLSTGGGDRASMTWINLRRVSSLELSSKDEKGDPFSYIHRLLNGRKNLFFKLLNYVGLIALRRLKYKQLDH